MQTLPMQEQLAANWQPRPVDRFLEQGAPDGNQGSSVHGLPGRALCHGGVVISADAAANCRREREMVTCCATLHCGEELGEYFAHLPCGHHLCKNCVLNWPAEECHLKCCHADGVPAKYERRELLRRWGYDEPQIQEPPQVTWFGRDFTKEAHKLQRPGESDAQANAPLERGLTVSEVCENDTCIKFRKEQLKHYAVGTIDFGDDGGNRACPCCLQAREPRELIFKNCHAQVRLCEAFLGGKKKFTNVNEEVRNVKRVGLPGHYTVMKVSASIDCPRRLLPEVGPRCPPSQEEVPNQVLQSS